MKLKCAVQILPKRLILAGVSVTHIFFQFGKSLVLKYGQFYVAVESLYIVYHSVLCDEVTIMNASDFQNINHSNIFLWEYWWMDKYF